VDLSQAFCDCCSPCLFVLFVLQDIKIIFEDDYIVVVDKPSGVLTVAGKQKDNPNLAQSVYDSIGGIDLPTCDHMVVHRLGMDTSGLIVFAKNIAAVRGMNGAFRERKVERQYEALVAGHVEKSEGMISLPLMRDYEFPPYVRISTYDHQVALLDLDPEEVGKKIWAMPKESITKYQVVSREEFAGQPVTRVTLTSITGRYHQLNCHLAAFGHPIVGDTIYGINGEACPNGGLTGVELLKLAPNRSRTNVEVLQAIADAAKGMPACVHAKSIKFRHPATKFETVELSNDSPF
jgi:tRNA pseudouridine32 synthase/23S rRNA pseudouridine746 synthase